MNGADSAVRFASLRFGSLRFASVCSVNGVLEYYLSMSMLDRPKKTEYFTHHSLGLRNNSLGLRTVLEKK